jgi:hypothetical protein
MTMSNYLWHVVGETPERIARFHPSTVKRTKAFAIAIHIPVLMWAVTGFLISSQIFALSPLAAALVALFCSGLIYLVERIVLATPKGMLVNVGRIVLGFVIAFLGASAVDLVIFEREVNQQLRESREQRVQARHDKTLDTQRQLVTQKKADWLKAQDTANCEANGTCGSMVRSVGPVYRELALQASELKSEYLKAQAHLGDLNSQKNQELNALRESGNVEIEAGLLTRIQALHDYVTNNTMALIAYALFFLLILLFELMVVLSKWAFGETVDDELDRIREVISQSKARDYLEAVTSPVAGAKRLLEY